jgi:hypothetical protein
LAKDAEEKLHGDHPVAVDLVNKEEEEVDLTEVEVEVKEAVIAVDVEEVIEEVDVEEMIEEVDAVEMIEEVEVEMTGKYLQILSC